MISIKNNGNFFFQNFSVCGAFPSVFLLFVRFFVFFLFKKFEFSADCRLFGGKREDFFDFFVSLYKIFGYQQLYQKQNLFGITHSVRAAGDILIKFSQVLRKKRAVDFFCGKIRFSTVLSVGNGGFPQNFRIFQRFAVDIPEFSEFFPHSLHGVFHRLWESLLKTYILYFRLVEIPVGNGEYKPIIPADRGERVKFVL